MKNEKNDLININGLIKKYKCDIRKIISLWKKGRNDFEVSQSLGIDMFKVIQIRQEIAYLHERTRQKKLKSNNPFKSNFIDKI